MRRRRRRHDPYRQPAPATGRITSLQPALGRCDTGGTAKHTRLDWQPWVLLFTLLVATLAAYHPAWHGGMVWDDDGHITAPMLRSWSGLYRIWFDIRATVQYYPLLHTVFWIEHRLWGDATLGYHLINILEHVIAAVMLALVLRRLAIPGAYLVAALFALHPVQVESVAWMSEQKNTLSTLFYLAAAMLYLRFDENRKAGWYAAAAAAFVLALLTKTVTATLPGALLVIFWWRRGRLSWKSDVLPLVPFIVVGAGAATITAWWELEVNHCVGPEFQFSFVERLLIAGRAIWFQLGKLFWPTNLAFMYPRWRIDTGAWSQYLFPLGVAVLAAILWMIRRRSRAPLAAFLFFCGTLFPVLGFFNLYTFRYSFVTNHYQYLAAVGPIALTVALLVTAIDRITARGTAALRAHSGLVRGLLLLPAIVFLAGVTWADSRKFESAEALLTDTIAKDNASWFAYTTLGAVRLAERRAEDAKACFEKALQLRPGLAIAAIDYNDLGNACLLEGDQRDATRDHEKAVELVPDYAEARNNLGLDFARSGDYPDAVVNYRRAIQSDPLDAPAHYNLANALLHTGDVAGAETHYRQAIALDEDFALGHYGLGLLLLTETRRHEAEEQLRTAFRLEPDSPQRYYGLARVYQQQGLMSEAAAAYEKALRIDPGYAEARCELAGALVQQDRLAEAIAEYQQAARMKPDYAAAHSGLGLALERLGLLEEAVAQYREALRIDPTDITVREALDRAVLAAGEK